MVLGSFAGRDHLRGRTDHAMQKINMVACILRCPKVEIFAKIFHENFQSLVWCRHVGVPLWDTNMAAGK